MKKIIGVIVILALVMALFTGCGNMNMGLGNFSFNKVHIDIHGYSSCVELVSWIDNSTGIEVKTERYGSIYLSEGTYILVEDRCPICDGGK